MKNIPLKTKIASLMIILMGLILGLCGSISFEIAFVGLSIYTLIIND